MTPRLKNLELQGYKSFASKVQFSFNPAITCVIGPNGSGKSNLVDAIRWVLGEQSYSLLRGRKTEDMIFNGSQRRSRASMAAVTVTFNNEDGWLPIEYSEVGITRRAFRDGQNEYLLNGKRVRYRDISELLGKVGLGQQTYTIVGQGLVDSALSLKPDDRRALFEEAAGIGVYRKKREDALKKLEQTAQNLTRVHDILAEIKPRLRSLERQAQRAVQYEQVKADLDAMLKLWYGYHWHRAQREVTASHQQAETLAAALHEQQAAQVALNTRLGQLRSEIDGYRRQLGTLRQQIRQRQHDHDASARELAVAETRQRSLQEQQTALEDEYQTLEVDLAARQQSLTAASEAHSTREVELAEAEQQAAAVESDREAHQAKRRAVEQQLAGIRREIEQIERQINQREAVQVERRAHLERLAGQRTAGEQALDQAQTQLTVHEQTLAEREGQLEAAQQARQSAEQAHTELEVHLAELDTRHTALADELAAAHADVERLAAREDVLGEQRASQAGAAGMIRQMAEQGKLAGAVEALVDLLDVPAEYDEAIAAALGSQLGALVLPGGQDVELALQALHQSQSGRATLIPLANLHPPDTLPAPDQVDFIGWAAGLVNCRPEHHPLAEALLGWAAVCRTTTAAGEIATSLPPGAMAVTLGGEVFHSSGAVEGGSGSGAVALALAREAQALPEQRAAAEQHHAGLEQSRQTLSQEREALRASMAEQQRTIQQTRNTERQAAAARDAARLDHQQGMLAVERHRRQLDDLADVTRQTEDKLAELAGQIEQLAGQRTETEAQVAGLEEQIAGLRDDALLERSAAAQTALAVARRVAQDSQARLEELQGAADRAAMRVRERASRRQTLAVEVEQLGQSIEAMQTRAAALTGELEETQEQINALETQQTGAEAKLREQEAEDQQVRARLQAAERRHSEAQLDLARQHNELDNLERRIHDDFGLVEMQYTDTAPGPTPLPLGEDMVERLLPVDELPDEIDSDIKRLRAQLRRLGAINPNAQQEFNEVKQRFEYMHTQIADLQAADEHLREVIAELDERMILAFGKTFKAVAREFKGTFNRLFGGGTAQLSLTHPNDPTNTGIDITAQLPGRRAQSLALLSGGERALTASALIFALLKVSPTPFAIMDEVDAALDEANVNRFREMLRELSTTTQFVVITHNRNTVEAADTVYGVSMGADSASQVISLRLDGDEVAGADEALLKH